MTLAAHSIGRIFPGVAIRRRELLPLVRDTIGHLYTVESEIARGGAARVFRATNQNGQAVALKVLRPELAVTVTADRFLREIALMADFDHPNVARLIDSGENDYLIYYVMPFMEGPTLRRQLTIHELLPADEVVSIARAMLSGLAYAHARDVVHRDVKPENIVLAEHGPVLVDFGIARAVAASGLDKVTRSGFAVGTSAYMSPEQVRGAGEIDPRSDIYSLGCVMFECLAGRPPFTHQNEQLVLRMHLEADAPSVREFVPDVDAGLEEVLAKALATDPDERWESATAMGEALARHAASR